jgi:uncharacterized membrane protein
MKLNWRSEWPQWGLLGGMFLLAALSWRSAPERISVHWGLDGAVDRWGGRVEGLLGPPLIALGLYLLLLWLPRVDPGQANYRTFAGPYRFIRLATLALLAALYSALVLSLRGVAIDMARVAPLLAGTLLVAIGSVSGKVRPNWFVGVRTPWTLSSKLAWTKTQCLGGWILIADGLLLAVAGVVFRSASAIGAALGALVGSLLLLYIYSWRVWRTDPYRTPPAGALPAEEEL